ncbi:MAG: hypothetical protein IJ636_08325 [Bacteroidales bacterium]|nr:hypothetical protein [Bacteroidales bacterium]
MNRTISDLLAVGGVFLLLLAFCASGWLALPHEAGGFSAILPAAGIILANCVLLFLVNERMLSGSSLLAGAIYLLLAAARPEALAYTPLHAASLLLAFSLTAYLFFNAEGASLKHLVAAWAGLGAAALLAPPLAWLIPVYAVSSVGKAEEKFKFWVAALLSLLLPLAVWCGISYLRGSESPLEILRGLWDGMCAVQRPVFHYPAASLCRLLLTAVAVVLAVIHVAARLDRYKTAQSRACLRLILMTCVLCLVTVLFFNRPGIPSGLVTALPVAPLLAEYFSHHVRGKGTGTLAVILILLLLAERVSYFV